MYYKEKMINGVLHFQTTPNGPWLPFSAQALSERLETERKEREALRSDLTEANHRAVSLKQENKKLTEELSASRVGMEIIGAQVDGIHALLSANVEVIEIPVEIGFLFK